MRANRFGFHQKRVFGVQTSSIEIDHLLKAWLAISLAFAIMEVGAAGLFSFSIVVAFLVSALTVGVGFLFHELAHKIVAQRYGCFAEFRANFQMLLLAIVMSFFGFLFAAPGAVVILGNRRINDKANGIISAAGPLMNFALALLFIPLMMLSNPLMHMIGSYGFTINAFLGLFNLIPIWMFDGAKVLRWSKLFYGLMVFVGFLLLFAQNIMGKLLGAN